MLNKSLLNYIFNSNIVVFLKLFSFSRTVIICMAALLLSAAASAQTGAAQSASAAGTVRPYGKVVKGCLPNGLTYYLCHNEEPKNRASYYIIRNVGSALESGSESGLAHFLEHMAFNGSRHFAPGKIVETLQRHGISYGGDLNAMTSDNETVYHISNVPADDSALEDTCLLVLLDWCHYLTLSDDEINRERGVIMGEWRDGNDAAFRMTLKADSVIYAGSPYAVRSTIGDTAVIKSFSGQQLRDFYRRWYRTDLTAVAVVGDIDTTAVRKKIEKMFADVPREKGPVRTVAAIPPHDDPRYVLATDREARLSVVTAGRIFRDSLLDGHTPTRRSDVEATVRETAFNMLMTSRITEITHDKDAPFVAAKISIADGRRNYHNYTMTAVCADSMEQAALDRLLTENRRALEHGFTEPEMSRVRKQLEAYVSNFRNNTKKIMTNDYIASAMRDNFLDNSGIDDPQAMAGAMMDAIEGLTAKDITDMARRLWTAGNRFVEIKGAAGAAHLSRGQALAMLARADTITTRRYADAAADKVLLAHEPAAGHTVKVDRKTLAGMGAEIWTMSNGTRVIYRRTTGDGDNISVTGIRSGGAMMLPDSLQPAASMLAQLAASYGLGTFTADDLRKKLSGTTAAVQVGLEPYFSTVNAAASRKDIVKAMQMLYMSFACPRFDADAHRSMLARLSALIPTFTTDPQLVGHDSVTAIVYNHHPKIMAGVITPHFLDAVTLGNVRKIYSNAFASAYGYTFIIVGNIERDTAMLLAERYIASLPAARQEIMDDNSFPCYPDRDVTRNVTVKGENPSAMVTIVYHHDAPFSYARVYTMNIMASILGERCENIIREQLGASYGVSCETSFDRIPKEQYDLTLSFECEPQRADTMRAVVRQQTELLCRDGVSEEEIDKYRSNWLKEREQSKDKNSYWRDKLSGWVEDGTDYNDDKNSTRQIKAVTPQSLKKTARQFFSHARKTDIKVMP